MLIPLDFVDCEIPGDQMHLPHLPALQNMEKLFGPMHISFEMSYFRTGGYELVDVDIFFSRG